MVLPDCFVQIPSERQCISYAIIKCGKLVENSPLFFEQMLLFQAFLGLRFLIGNDEVAGSNSASSSSSHPQKTTPQAHRGVFCCYMIKPRRVLGLILGLIWVYQDKGCQQKNWNGLLISFQLSFFYPFPDPPERHYLIRNILRKDIPDRDDP